MANIPDLFQQYNQKQVPDLFANSQTTNSKTQSTSSGGIVKEVLKKIASNVKYSLKQNNPGELTKVVNGKLVTNEDALNKLANITLGFVNPESGVTGGIRSELENLAGKTANKTSTLAEYLMNKAFGVNKKTIKAGYSPAREMLAQGVKGGAETLKNKTQTIIDKLGPAVDAELKKNNTEHSINDIFSKLATKLKSEGGTFNIDELKSIVRSAAPKVRDYVDKITLTTSELNKFRSGLDSVLTDKFFLTNTHPFNKEVVGGIANIARDRVQNTVESTKPMFKKWSAAITANKAIKDKLAADAAKAVPFILASGAGLVGEVTGGHKKALEYAILEEAIRRGRKNPAVLTNLAHLLNRVGENGAANLLTKFASVVGKLKEKNR